MAIKQEDTPEFAPMLNGTDNMMRLPTGGPTSRFDSSQPSIAEKLRSALSVSVGGGQLSPEVGGGRIGAKWSKTFTKGGKVSSASKRADGCVTKGKTKGKFV
jgi:hypothetical protein